MDEQTAVLEVPVPETLEELASLVEAKKAEVDELRPIYQDLWRQRKAGTLERPGGYVAFMSTEDRLGILTRDLAVLEPHLAAAQKRAAVHAAVEHHDAEIPDLRALAEMVLHDIGTLADHLAALSGGFQGQVDPLFQFQDRRNMQAFDVQDGHTYTRQLVGNLFPSDFRAPAMVDLLLMTPPLTGNYQGALEGCPRLKPYSPIAINTYLRTITEGIAHVQNDL